jgi:hypothetical protein
LPLILFPTRLLASEYSGSNCLSKAPSVTLTAFSSSGFLALMSKGLIGSSLGLLCPGVKDLR